MLSNLNIFYYFKIWFETRKNLIVEIPECQKVEQKFRMIAESSRSFEVKVRGTICRWQIKNLIVFRETNRQREQYTAPPGWELKSLWSNRALIRLVGINKTSIFGLSIAAGLNLLNKSLINFHIKMSGRDFFLFSYWK